GGRRIARDRRGPSVRRRGPSRDEIPGARVLARRVTMIALLQRGLRALFMGAEALINRAFGDRLNPLYHLGAITFFLFWIVAVTGIALYVFFDTSVHGAYASVERITQGLWGLGGILRGAHRYASDAMMLTMCLHLARHFAFDRLRGFRWFAWVTGVALLW